MTLNEVALTLPDGEQVSGPFLSGDGTNWWLQQLRPRRGISVDVAGSSRAGRPLPVITIGEGTRHASITAGAHADEPAGPLAAIALAWFLSGHSAAARQLRTNWTFTIFPQVNPDGAEANRPWFAPVPDVYTYLRHVKRELPGDDVEFAYPFGDQPALRPENEAIARYLRRVSGDNHSPFRFHASLHSMGFAAGAWVLIGKSWVERTGAFRAEVSRIASERGFALHDIDRRGEKGFSRIQAGFCTTPSSSGMKQFFLDKDDPEMAARFGRNSMEYVQSLGGDPLVMVTEIPNFSIGGGFTPGRPQPAAHPQAAPAPGSTLYEKSRADFRDVAGGQPDDFGDAWRRTVADLVEKYGVVPVPFGEQAALMTAIVLQGLQASE